MQWCRPMLWEDTQKEIIEKQNIQKTIRKEKHVSILYNIYINPYNIIYLHIYTIFKKSFPHLYFNCD